MFFVQWWPKYLLQRIAGRWCDDSIAVRLCLKSLVETDDRSPVVAQAPAGGMHVGGGRTSFAGVQPW